MPQIDRTTASHRTVIPLPMFLLLDAIAGTACANGHREPGEPLPSVDTVREALNAVAEIPYRFLFEAEIGTFYGEIHISWAKDGKQVILMFFPNRTPLVHHYHKAPGINAHDIEEARVERIIHWLGWLHD